MTGDEDEETLTESEWMRKKFKEYEDKFEQMQWQIQQLDHRIDYLMGVERDD